jgi:hypothetical protein
LHTGAGVRLGATGTRAGTDILVVRRTKSIPTAIGSLVGGSIYVQASGCNAELQQLHTKDLVVGLGSGGAGAFVLHKRDCVNTAEVFEFQTRIYYISRTRRFRRHACSPGATSTNELVEGIEDMYRIRPRHQ